MMAKRRAARHDPLETVIPTAHWPIGDIDYKVGWSLLGCGSRDGDGNLCDVANILPKGRKQDGVCGEN